MTDTMDKHTPGPWKYEETLDGFSFYGPPDSSGFPVRVCGAESDYDLIFLEEPTEADTRLIAAAPDLLEALLMVKKTCGSAECWNGETRAFIQATDAAIAKARGRS